MPPNDKGEIRKDPALCIVPLKLALLLLRFAAVGRNRVDHGTDRLGTHLDRGRGDADRRGPDADNRIAHRNDRAAVQDREQQRCRKRRTMTMGMPAAHMDILL